MEDEGAAERERLLRALAASVTARRLDGAARLALDVAAPLEVVGCQLALFVQPLLPVNSWRQYAALFAQQASWRELRHLLEPLDR